jgi:Protein of unknown function (DUF4435)
MRSKVRSHQAYKDAACMFFVDSDFDQNKEFEDTYITPCYSIENLYVSKSAFIRVLNAEFGLSEVCENAECFHKSIHLYENSKAGYLKAISQFNYIIRELRVMEPNGDLKKLNINNINFGTLVKVNLKKSVKCYDESNVSSIFPDPPSDLVINTSNSETHFSQLDHEMWYRGKQHLEFFRHYISLLKDDRCSKSERRVFQNRGNVRLNLTKGNCLSELSQYADTPICLRKFLENQNPTPIAV